MNIEFNLDEVKSELFKELDVPLQEAMHENAVNAIITNGSTTNFYPPLKDGSGRPPIIGLNKYWVTSSSISDTSLTAYLVNPVFYSYFQQFGTRQSSGKTLRGGIPPRGMIDFNNSNYVKKLIEILQSKIS